MNRYAQLLAQTVERHGRDDPATRRSAYEEVRQQLDRLLALQNPRMPDSAEEQHRRELEQAIGDFERALTEPATPRVSAPLAAEMAPQSEGRGMAPIPRVDVGDRPGGPSLEISPADRSLDPDEPGVERSRRSPWRLVWIVVLTGLLAAIAGVVLVLAPLHMPDVPPDAAVAERLSDQRAATLFLGSAVTRFQAQDGIELSARRMPFSRGAVRITRLGSAGRNAGAQIVLAPQIREALADKLLRVVVVARAAEAAPSPTMSIAIIDGDTSSGWETAQLGDRFSSYEVSYRFGPATQRGGTAIVIRPQSGEGRSSLDVSEVSLFVAR